MKNNVFKLSGFILMILTFWSCSKTETATSPTALKDALTSSAQNLNTAMTDIASSQAFQLLSVSSSGMTTMKSGTVYSANIPLDLVKGVYDYKALKTNESRNYALIKFFTKSADASKMVVNMPLAKFALPDNPTEPIFPVFQGEGTLTVGVALAWFELSLSPARLLIAETT